jgi:hypothetical protein
MHQALQCLQKGLSPNRSEHGKTNQTQFVVVRCVSASPSQDSGLAYIKPGFVDITCCDSTLFREWHSDRVFRAVDLLLQAHRRVEAGTFTKTDYEDMEMSMGLNRNAAGLLASPTLRSRGRRKPDSSRCCPLGIAARGGHQRASHVETDSRPQATPRHAVCDLRLGSHSAAARRLSR